LRQEVAVEDDLQSHPLNKIDGVPRSFSCLINKNKKKASEAAVASPCCITFSLGVGRGRL